MEINANPANRNLTNSKKYQDKTRIGQDIVTFYGGNKISLDSISIKKSLKVVNANNDEGYSHSWS